MFHSERHEFQVFENKVWQMKNNRDNTRSLSIWEFIHIHPIYRMNNYIIIGDKYQPTHYSQIIGGTSDEETVINGVNRKWTSGKQTRRPHLRAPHGEGYVCYE